MNELRKRWKARDPNGRILEIEYDRLRQRWRITSGGYEARTLDRAIADDRATCHGRLIVELTKKLDPQEDS